MPGTKETPTLKGSLGTYLLSAGQHIGRFVRGEEWPGDIVALTFKMRDKRLLSTKAHIDCAEHLVFGAHYELEVSIVPSAEFDNVMKNKLTKIGGRVNDQQENPPPTQKGTQDE